MSPKALAELLEGKDVAPVLALDESSLGDTGDFGPAAYYYLARWLDSREALLPVPASPAGPAGAERSRLLYRIAYDRSTGLVKRESGLALIDRLSSGGLWEELRSFRAEFAEAVGPEWRSERPGLEALDALKADAEERALVEALRRLHPAEAAGDADALAYFGAAADLRTGGAAWPASIRRLALELPGSDWTERAIALVEAEPRVRALFSQEELHALAMRVAVRRKDYALACAEALLGASAAMGRSASQAMISDAGKAFLYSGSLKEKAVGFSATGWTARYYRARFARALERWKESESAFRKCAADAPTRADADSCRWYAADCAYRGALAAAALAPLPARAAGEAAARKAALDGLVAASESWRDPAAFSDLVNGLYRDALRARDWPLLAAMAERLAGRCAADASARIAYTAARAYELGLGPAASSTYAAIAGDPAAPLNYRALAAWRAGVEPIFVPADSPQAAVAKEAAGEAEAFVAGIAGFGLGDIALAEARARKAEISDAGLRRLAALFSSRGRPDCALRLALELTSRPGYAPRRSDFELLYPRAYMDEIRSIKIEPKVSERLALALVRSESVFRADAVSWAGAIGLSQLMPSTAADAAKALGLSSYDLRSPKDNLTIGLSHFASLLARTEGRPLRAMMAYNAGWGRLRTWSGESAELPDDLMVEALGIEETRQYCRNILQATVMYGELYYGKGVGETVEELVEGVKD